MVTFHPKEKRIDNDDEKNNNREFRRRKKDFNSTYLITVSFFAENESSILFINNTHRFSSFIFKYFNLRYLPVVE